MASTFCIQRRRRVRDFDNARSSISETGVCFRRKSNPLVRSLEPNTILFRQIYYKGRCTLFVFIVFPNPLRAHLWVHYYCIHYTIYAHPATRRRLRINAANHYSRQKNNLKNLH